MTESIPHPGHLARGRGGHSYVVLHPGGGQPEAWMWPAATASPIATSAAQARLSGG